MTKNTKQNEKDFYKYFRFDAIYLGNSKYLTPGYIALDSNGTIQYLSNKTPQTKKAIKSFTGLLLPGFINAHSHAFQRSMAGLCEFTTKKAKGKDDFWTWRSKMYELAEKQNPESIFRDYTKIFAEMIRHGFNHVVEFHYLHGIENSTTEDKLSFEMSLAVSEAAKNAGIGLTLLPVLYQRGGVNKPSNQYQKKFSFKNFDTYSLYYENLKSLYQKKFPDFILGTGVHSLRAVEPECVKKIFNSNFFNGPKHIHAAEQTGEVEEIYNEYGKRPIEWLAKNNCLNPQTHIVHATHTTEEELATIVKMKSSVVLCPSTEANLGDGFFPIESFHKKSGKWSIGTDSHITLNFFEELRWLDYGCRLRLQKRLSLVTDTYLHPAEYLFDTSIQNGKSAAGLAENEHYFSKNQKLNGVICNVNCESFHEASPSNKLSMIIYTGDSSNITHMFFGGKIHKFK